MLGKFIRKKVSHMMNGQNDTAVAMSGKFISDPDFFPKLDKSKTIEQQTEDLISQMTLEEKINLLGGEENLAISGIPRLHIPRVWCSDATAGARCFGRATAFPVPIAQTATWNPLILSKIGQVLGEECRAKGVSVLLAPGVNIYRVPTNGRNFEYMGEDPFLASRLVVPFIEGVQSKGVITTVKHFACNNSDFDRHRMNSEVDERTLHEIYFPIFKAAITEAKSKGIMCAYNPVNGTYSSENPYLLTEILRDQWKFNGFVISDWTCTYSTKGPLLAGLDIEMPKGIYLNYAKIKPLLDRGIISEKEINFHVKNIIHTFIETGIYSRSIKDQQFKEYGLEHDQIALDCARESIVLLKNQDYILPINQKENIQNIIVLGRTALETPTSGGGSCYVQPHSSLNIIESLEKFRGSKTEITYISTPKQKISQNYVQQIQEAHYVLVCVGFTKEDESECWDRPWILPYKQNKLIESAAKLNPNVIVIITAGGGIETESWLNQVKAVLHTFYLGQSSGIAIAEILYGITNPSGKLPFTMAKHWNDFATIQNYVKKPEKISILRIIGPQGKPQFRPVWTVKYLEKLMVGYRHFDTNQVDPQFAFGHGLSYTEFTFDDLTLSKNEFSETDIIKIKFTVENVGNHSGAEVAQLYIHDKESSLSRPFKELKGFQKVFLEPKERKEVEIELDINSFSFYDPDLKKWIAEPGEFEIFLGNSSRNLPLHTTIVLI